MSSKKRANWFKSGKKRASKPRVTLDEPYDVEFILDKQVKESRIMYQIWWHGFPLEKDHTWEPIENIGTVVGHIHEYEEKNTGRQLKTAKIKPKLVAQYRERTIEKEQMTQVLGFDTANQVLFVLWTNAMVITLPVKELDSVFLHGISCLINKNFEKNFNKNKNAFDRKVEALIESEKKSQEETGRDENEPLPNADDTRRLSNVLENALRANGWPEVDPTGMMVSPLMAQDRTEYGDVIIQCTLCDTCGERFERPNVAFFQHLRQSGHNGSYLKDVIF